jgi:hypothetical protein
MQSALGRQWSPAAKKHFGSYEKAVTSASIDYERGAKAQTLEET